VEADVRGGRIAIALNGLSVAEFTDAEPLTGPLHGWFGMRVTGGNVFRNLRIWSSAKDTSRERQLTRPVTEKPLANGELLYELKLTGARELGSEWWQSFPKIGAVDNGTLVVSSTGNTPHAILLTKPLSRDLACEVEFEYQTPLANRFSVMLWSAKKAPQSAQECDAGCIVDLPNAAGKYAVQWHGGSKDAVETFLGSRVQPLYFTPYHVPIVKRKYLARIEMNRDKTRVFMDGGLVLTTQRPNSSALPAMPVFFGMRQYGGGVAALKVHAVRIYQLATDGKANPSALREQGMSHLHPLPLQGLHLSNTSLTDAGLARLTGCKQLREVQAYMTKVTAAGVADFKAALPQCSILHDDFPAIARP
jgi:hypothetical protein